MITTQKFYRQNNDFNENLKITNKNYHIKFNKLTHIPVSKRVLSNRLYFYHKKVSRLIIKLYYLKLYLILKSNKVCNKLIHQLIMRGSMSIMSLLMLKFYNSIELIKFFNK